MSISITVKLATTIAGVFMLAAPVSASAKTHTASPAHPAPAFHLKKVHHRAPPKYVFLNDVLYSRR
jgi:hypothetical protein